MSRTQKKKKFKQKDGKMKNYMRESLMILFSVFSILEKLLLSALFCPSVTASSLQGIDRSCPFMAQSIAYGPKTCLKKDNFLGPVL
jgi:hypothetical protein